MTSDIAKYIALCKEHIGKNYAGMFRESGGVFHYPFLTPGSESYADMLWDWDSWSSNVAPRQVLSDLLWRATIPLLKAVASVRYAPSRGLAAALGLGDAVVILPPGTDRSAPDLGIGEADVVGAILQFGSGNGFENLVAART